MVGLGVPAGAAVAATGDATPSPTTTSVPRVWGTPSWAPEDCEERYDSAEMEAWRADHQVEMEATRTERQAEQQAWHDERVADGDLVGGRMGGRMGGGMWDRASS